MEGLKGLVHSISAKKEEAMMTIRSLVDQYCEKHVSSRSGIDQQVGRHFSNKPSLMEVIA